MKEEILVSEPERGKYRLQLIVLTILFFMWGFITCMNDILIPYLKKVFELGYFQAMMVQFSFFGAYFIGSLLYFIVSHFKGDPIQKMGYKNGILMGLFISAVACFLFYPAAHYKVYAFFLGALFVLGLGFTLLQIAANPYVAILGPSSSSSSRLNLSQGFNSFGTTIAPIIGGYLIFHYFAQWGVPLLDKGGNPVLSDTGSQVSAASVQLPYLIFGVLFLLVALVIKITPLPRYVSNEKTSGNLGALRYRHLVLGMMAIFMYVGGEVSIGSMLIVYLRELMDYPEMVSKSFLAFYWGGAMIGRFTGSVMLAGNLKLSSKVLWMVVISSIGFLVIFTSINLESSMSLKTVMPFLLLIAANLVGFLFGRSLPHRTVMVFALIVIGLLITTVVSGGLLALWAVIGIGLFNSIMWSNIFTLAIKDLGPDTSQGSSLLIMAILGGALIPLLQGKIADISGVQISFVVPVICYLYIAFYGWKGYKPVKALSKPS